MSATQAAIQPIDAFARLGTESAFEVLARAVALQAQGKDIINLGIGQPDFKTPDHVVEASIKALRDGHHGYTPANGIKPLREAVAADIQKHRGAKVDPENVLVVPGGKVTMAFAVMMLGAPGREIMYPNPGFPIYESLINFTGAKAVPIALKEEDGFAFDPDAVLAQVTPRTSLVIVNTPANPTGGVVSRAKLDRLAQGLAKHPHVCVMSDEIYGRLLFDGHQHATLYGHPALGDRVILLDGWSKTYAMTGWRLGYGVWPKSLIAHATRLAINVHSCVNAPAQFAAIAALQGPQDAVETMRKAFSERRGVVVKGLNALPGVRCVEPGGAFYAFPNIAGTGMKAKAFETGLLDEAGIATIAGTSFGKFGEGYLRVSYANSLENIRKALDRMGNWLTARKAA